MPKDLNKSIEFAAKAKALRAQAEREEDYIAVLDLLCEATRCETYSAMLRDGEDDGMWSCIRINKERGLIPFEGRREIVTFEDERTYKLGAPMFKPINNRGGMQFKF